MDYEKKYKEALDRARQFITKELYAECNGNLVEYIFPELKEGEDERIRKALLRFHASTIDIDGIQGKEILAWLEKQGYTKKDVDDAYLKGICNTKHELEKQGDQKSVDKEYTFKSIPRLLDMIEPTDRAKSYCKKLIDSLQTEGYSVDAKIVGECLKQMNGEKVAMAVMDNEKQDEKKSQRMVSAEAKEALYDKPTDEEMKELLRTEYEKGRADTIAEMGKEWSEEDDVMINKLLAVVKLYYDRSGDDLDKQSCISFLKSLKDKVQPQPKQEWSEEDEKVIAIINNALTESNTPPNDYDKVYEWLESIKQRIGE